MKRRGHRPDAEPHRGGQAFEADGHVLERAQPDAVAEDMISAVRSIVDHADGMEISIEIVMGNIERLAAIGMILRAVAVNFHQDAARAHTVPEDEPIGVHIGFQTGFKGP